MCNILIGHRAERDNLALGDYVARQGAPAARAAMASGLIKLITGPRRAGKSVFAFQMLAEANFAYVNFDDERLYDLTDFDELLRATVQVYGETKTFLFDEIQNVERWELFVSHLHRQRNNILLARRLSSILTTRAGSGGGEHRHPLPSCGHLLRGSMGSTIAIA
jgi:chloramphenicol 3-O-phosphotransferase